MHVIMLQWFFLLILLVSCLMWYHWISHMLEFIYFLSFWCYNDETSVSLFSANLVGNGIAFLYWGSKTQGLFGIKLIFHFFVDSSSKYAQYLFYVRRVLPLSIHMDDQTDDNGPGASSFASEIEGENIVSLVVLFSSLLHLWHC